MEQELKAFLHALLKGNRSPIFLSDKKLVIYNIHEYYHDIGKVYAIEAVYKKDETWSCTINEEIEFKDSRDFLLQRSQFISTKRETVNFNTMLNLKNQPTNIEKMLREKILSDKGLTPLDIHLDSDNLDFTQTTFRFFFATFPEKLTDKSLGELRIIFYNHYLHKEINELRIELEKTIDADNYKWYVKTIDFYSNKFKILSENHSDPNIRACYKKIIKDVTDLKTNIELYVCDKPKIVMHNELIWQGSYKEFIDFFNSEIDATRITYNWESNKYAKSNIDNVKLEWSEYVDEFVDTFFPLTELDSKNNRQLMANPKDSRNKIFSLLYEIFWITNQKYPDQEILLSTLRTNVASYPNRMKEKEKLSK
jgi:hypothetical protein